MLRRGFMSIRASVKAAIAQACERAINRAAGAGSTYVSTLFRHVPIGSVEIVVDRYIGIVNNAHGRAMRQAALEMVGVAGQVRPGIAEKYLSFMSRRASFDRDPAIRKIAGIILNDWRPLVSAEAARTIGRPPLVPHKKRGASRRRNKSTGPAPGERH